MSLPRLVITGSSGFVGRHLIDAIKEHYQIFGLARRTQARSGAPVHPNITWFQADIADRAMLQAAFDRIARSGGADYLIHLAAHYDFTGEEHDEYQRTNVDGLRNVLEAAGGLGIRRFIFSSSLAACQFPPPGGALTETSPPDGDHIYARTKAIGEKMVVQYADRYPSAILRFAALFSDWCEYPPLFMFLGTWLSGAWNRRVLGGRGQSAIPFMHVREIPAFMMHLLSRERELAPGEILIASPDGAVSHQQLFAAATLDQFGRRLKPIHMPRVLCGPGIRARDLLGRLTGQRPFERPWMADYIDLSLTVDSSVTRRRLGWAPRARLEIVRRIPFMLENFRTDPIEWHRRNRAAMKQVRLRVNLRIYHMLERHEDEILEGLVRRIYGATGGASLPHYQSESPDFLQWHVRLAMRNLFNAVRTRERSLFTAYCADLAERRFHQGFTAEEVCEAMEMLGYACMEVLAKDPEAKDLDRELHEHVIMTLRFGIDQIIESFDQRIEQLGWPRDAAHPGEGFSTRPDLPPETHNLD